MKREKWYRYKSPNGKNVVYSPDRYLAVCSCDGDYYEYKGRSHMSRKKRMGLYVYRGWFIVVKSKHPMPDIVVGMPDNQGFVDDVDMELVDSVNSR